MAQKNLILAVVASMMFMIFWQTFIVPKEKISERNSVSSPAEAQKTPLAGIAAVSEKEHQVFQQADYESFVLENDNLKIVFNEEGASIESYYLKEKEGEINLIPEALNGEPKNLFFYSKNAAFRKSPKIEKVPLDGGTFSKVSFVAAADKNLRIEKNYYIADEGFLHRIEHRISNMSRTVLDFGDSVLVFGSGMKIGSGKGEIKETRAIGYKDFNVTNFKKGTHENDYAWLGLDSRYFFAAVLNSQAAFGMIDVGKEKNALPSISMFGKEQRIESSQTFAFDMPFYIGPKSYYDLEALDLKLEESINFGFFGFLSKYALKTLHILYGITKNYGFAIIILTVMLQILLFPLTAKSFKASLGMKKLQPQIKILQEKYKQDQKRLNVEMLNLYKSSRTNPFGGCLPMILQIPVFWALFTTLRGAYELRNAPFVFWIKDLSAPDPLYVLPILMGIGMFVQQKFLAASADPTQAKMAYIMPVVLTVLFINFPAGLVLYWLTNNVVTGIQQYAMLRVQERNSGQ